MNARIAVDALNNTASRRGDVTGCVVHSDRGSQFRSRESLRALEHHGLVGSIGRVAAAMDNAAMESFSALLQKSPQQAIPSHQETIAVNDRVVD